MLFKGDENTMTGGVKMLLDERSKKLIEIDRVLSELHPVTPFGQKLRIAMKPYEIGSETELFQEFERIEKIKELIKTQNTLFRELKIAMRQLKDLRNTLERSLKDSVLTQVEFFELKNFASNIKVIASCVDRMMWKVPEEIRPYSLQWLEKLLDPERSGIKTFYIYDCYSQLLSQIRKDRCKLEFDLEKSNLEKSDLEKSDLEKNYQKELEYLRGEEAAEELEVLKKLSKEVSSRAKEILRDMDCTGRLDLLISKAEFATEKNLVKPIFSKDSEIVILKGRHILVESYLRKNGKEYTPINLTLTKGVALITGANMGGKTVSLKMIGLLQAMFQYGLFVPAEDFRSELFEFIHVSAGDEQSLDKGLSTFGAEIKNINEALIKSEKSGLILIDELARGTNPHEGYAISAAIISYLKNKNAKTVITTHFDGLVSHDIKHLQVKGLKEIDFSLLDKNCQISDFMDYSLVNIIGEIGIPRDAINISRMMGMPDEILKNAEELLLESEAGSEDKK